MCVRVCTGGELREQVAHLQQEYSSIGDELEQEQSRSQQVTLHCCPAKALSLCLCNAFRDCLAHTGIQTVSSASCSGNAYRGWLAI